MQSKEEGAHVGGYIEFELGTEVVEVRIGSSFIDFEQASVNLEKEIPASVSFEQTKKKVKAAWESNLDKIRIKGATDDDATIFIQHFFALCNIHVNFLSTAATTARLMTKFTKVFHTMRIHCGIHFVRSTLGFN